MDEDDDTPKKSPSELSTRSRWEHAQNIVVAGLAGISIIPGCGTLASLLSEYLPDWKLQRIQTFLEELAGDFEELKREVDEAKANTIEYGLRVEYVLRQVSQSASNVKAEAYRAVLVNGVTNNAPSESEQAYFLSRLDGLDELNVVVVGMITAVGRGDSALVVRLRSHLVQHDLDLIQSAYNDLVQMGMALHSGNAAGHLTIEADEGHIHNLLTPLGKRFAEFVTLA